jgi:hypothetical protein
MYAELFTLVTVLADGTDKVPEEEDVKAGWVAFALFGLLIAAVVFLGFSLVKRLRNAERAEAQGLYDHTDEDPTPPDNAV